jgi:glutamine amidotransferase
MARLFGLIGNRSDLAGRVLAHESEILKVKNGDAGVARGWGLGFYQGGEVLMRRRPLDDRPEIDIAKAAEDIRTDALLGHIRTATVGALRTENTHPFRYRQWLFALTGTISSYDLVRDRLLQTVPEFLRAGIRGDTDAEVAFHVFLSFLHDRGRLNDDLTDPTIVVEAIRQTIAVLDGTGAEVGGEPSRVNLMVTNGFFIVALHLAEKMAYRVLAGKQDADAIVGDDEKLRQRTPERARMHFSLVASDNMALPPRWNAVPDRAMVVLTRDEDPRIVT